MRIVRARLAPIRLRLRAPLATAHGPVFERRGVLIRIDTDDGRSGLGEATPVEGFGLESADAAGDALAKLAAVALGRDPREADRLLERAELIAPDCPCARFAFDTALHDLAAQAAGRSLAGELAHRASPARHPRARVDVSALLVACDPRAAAEEAERAVREGFRTLKLKVGGAALEDDPARVAAVRGAVGPRIALRLDANGAWSADEAIAHARRLASFDPEWIEQPVPAGDVAGLARVRLRTGLPIAADEAATTPESVERLLAAGAADVLVLKPAAAGGLRASERLAARARDAGVAVAVTTILDGAVGRAAARAFAASLPGPLPACGLATAALLAEDLVSEDVPRDGALATSAVPGLGVSLDPARLARVSVGRASEIRAEVA